MKLINSAFIILAICIAATTFADNRMMSLNSDDLKILSKNSFKLKIDQRRNIRVLGQWPDVCGKSVAVSSIHRNSILEITINVSQDCYSLLLGPIDEMTKIPTTSMTGILVKGIVRQHEKVVLTSINPALDLNLSPDQVETIMRNEQINPTEPNPAPSFLGNKYGSSSKGSTIEGGMAYRKCDPINYGSSNPSVCNGRYGVDLNADLKLNDSTSLRGTTQIDLQNQPGDNLSGKAGIRLDILIQIDDMIK